MRQSIARIFERHTDAVQAAQALQRNGCLGPAQVQVTSRWRPTGPSPRFDFEVTLAATQTSL
jgi:hypothetical protein